MPRPPHGAIRAALAQVILTAFVVTSSACNPVYYVGVRFLYKRADLPASQVLHDVLYAIPGEAPKQQLDLFTPAGRGWPTVIFVHGGNWTEGDRSFSVGGADVYGNIGRFFASHGAGAAIISYRLIPTVDWRTQAGDVVKAVRWVYDTIPVFGGRRDAIFVMGHSAGAELAVRTALDTRALAAVAVPASAILGVIAVSGAGYDLTDQATYALGDDPEFYARRFRMAPTDVNWQREASVIQFVGPRAPASLILFASGDTKALHRQSYLLHTALEAAGSRTRLLEVPGQTHTRIVPTLSRNDRLAGATILEFVQSEAARSGRPAP